MLQQKKTGGKSYKMDQDSKDQMTILNNIKTLMYEELLIKRHKVSVTQDK